jgi:hypothetical protein
MTAFKPPARHDDQVRIRSDVAHDVRVGGNARVSIGGMRQATVRVSATGKDGISGTDSQGRTYHFLWEHVIGPTNAAPDDVKAAANPDADAPMHKSHDPRIDMLKAQIDAFRR